MSYELAALAVELKAKGLNLAEDAAMNVIEAVEEWAKKEAAKGEKPMVDGIVLALAPMLCGLAKSAADKIDGQDDVK
jgi:hypothetical protein